MEMLNLKWRQFVTIWSIDDDLVERAFMFLFMRVACF